MKYDIDVSVIMPAYNAVKYIDNAIESVLKQKGKFELIIVNDFSTDNTEQIIQQYKEDTRIVYIKNSKNIGVAASRNKGVQIAKGKYIAFLDSDDIWTEDKLEKQIKLMEEKQAVISSTGRALIDENGQSLDRFIGIPLEVTYQDLLKGNVLNTSGVMLLATVAKEYPMVQDHLHEDYILWLTILKKYGKAYGINEPMLQYRIMKGTKSANKLKSAKMTFGVYRYMGLNFIKSCYYFCFYAIHGILKYHG